MQNISMRRSRCYCFIAWNAWLAKKKGAVFNASSWQLKTDRRRY
jgi:hypothetical protein